MLRKGENLAQGWTEISLHCCNNLAGVDAELHADLAKFRYDIAALGMVD